MRFAKNSDDLFFAQGFIAAQDRLFQLDLWRRLAVGETAAIVGPAGIEKKYSVPGISVSPTVHRRARGRCSGWRFPW